MNIELKEAAQQALDAFDAFGDADDFASLFELTQKMRALRTAIQQAEAQQPAAPEPVAALVRSRRIRTPAHCAFDKKDHYSEWSDWEPCTLSYARAVTDPARDRGLLPLYEMLPLYTHPAPSAPATGEPVAWLHVCRKKPELRELSFSKAWPNLAALGYKARPLVLGDTQPAPSVPATTEPVVDVRCEGCGYMTHHREHMGCVRAAKQHTQPAPSVTEPVAWLDEMLADTREVFDAGGSETPQVVRDVIEYVKSWVTVYSEKNHPAPAAHPAPSVPADVVRDAERYWWLRNLDHWPAPFSSSQEPEPIRGADLDAAIDAAMLAAK